MAAEWMIGVFLCLAGAALTNFGLTLQKLSFLRTDELLRSDIDKDKARIACLQPLWIIGFTIFLIGQVAGMVAMGFSSQSVVATLGSFALVTNAILAPCILKEPLTYPHLISIAIIIAGSVIVILSSNHNNQDYTLTELMTLFKRDLFIIYMGALGICLILCCYQMWREHTKNRDAAKEEEEFLAAAPAATASTTLTNADSYTVSQDTESPTGVDTGQGGYIVNGMNSNTSNNNNSSINTGLQNDLNESLMNGRHQHQISDANNPDIPASPGTPTKPLLSPTSSSSPRSPQSPSSSSALSSFTPTLTAAILSSASVLLGKCTMQLIKTSLQSVNQFTAPLSYIISAVFIVCAIASVHMLNIGLRRGAALFVVPFYYVSSTSLAIVGGLVYFEEFQDFSVIRCAMFFGGVGLTIIGVWISTKGTIEEEEEQLAEEEEEQSEDEDMIITDIQTGQPIDIDRDGERDTAAITMMSDVEDSEHKVPSPSLQEHTTPSPDNDVVPVIDVTRAPGMILEEDEDRESAKIRAWHSYRTVSEPHITYTVQSPTRRTQSTNIDTTINNEYGTFNQPSSSLQQQLLQQQQEQHQYTLTSPRGTSLTHSPALSRPATVAVSNPYRPSRAHSLSVGEPWTLPHRTLHSRMASLAVTPSRAGSHQLHRRPSVYQPHYTLAFYPLLPSNPISNTSNRKRKPFSRSVSVSVAGSRPRSPLTLTPRRLQL